jgi:hypothetical protein
MRGNIRTNRRQAVLGLCCLLATGPLAPAENQEVTDLGDTGGGNQQQAEIEATTIPPPNDFESAIVRTLGPGNYTAIVRGVNDATAIGVVEIYTLN